MKKALILSLGLAVVFGLTGCTTEDKIEKPEVVVEVDESPVMVLGGEEAIDDSSEETTE